LTASTTFRYRVVTAGGAGTVTSAWASFTTPHQATKLAVNGTVGHVQRGTLMRVRVDRLQPREAYSVALRGSIVARGVASAEGTANRRFRIPAKARTGTVQLTVTGAQADRTGSDSVRITAPV